MRVPYTQSATRFATPVRVASLLALVVGACSEVPEAGEEVTERTSAVVTTYHYTDVSGKLQFSVSSCTATPAATGLRCAGRTACGPPSRRTPRGCPVCEPATGRSTTDVGSAT